MHNRHNGKNNRPLGYKLILSFSHVGSFRFMTVVRTSSRKKVPHAFQTPKYTTE